MQNKNKLELSSIDGYLGDFKITPGTYHEKPRSIDYEDVGILIKELEKGKIKVNTARSTMVLGNNKSKRVFKLDLQTKPNSLLIGYSLIIDKNLEVNIRDSSEVLGYNKQSEPPFIIPGIEGTFMFYPSDSKKERPSPSLLSSVEQAVRNYY